MPLDEALALYERGEALHRALGERLDRAELRIEELRSEDASAPRDTAPPEG